jgi:hypothetical protein
VQVGSIHEAAESSSISMPSSVINLNAIISHQSQVPVSASACRWAADTTNSSSSNIHLQRENTPSTYSSLDEWSAAAPVKISSK